MFFVRSQYSKLDTEDKIENRIDLQLQSRIIFYKKIFNYY